MGLRFRVWVQGFGFGLWRVSRNSLEFIGFSKGAQKIFKVFQPAFIGPLRPGAVVPP